MSNRSHTYFMMSMDVSDYTFVKGEVFLAKNTSRDHDTDLINGLYFFV